jgi:hypothetical protein
MRPSRIDPRALALSVLPIVVLLVVGVLTPAAALFPHQGDVDLYRQVAAAVAGGRLPYRDFPFPYPPLALIPMVVPFLLSGSQPSLDTYHWLFLGWEAVLLVALVVTVRRIAAIQAGAVPGDAAARVEAVSWRMLILTLAAALPIAWRFDLAPALMTAAALLAALEDRPAAAGVALGLGVLAKLYPAVLVPVVAVRWVGRRRWPGLGQYGLALAATLAIVVAPFVLATGGGLLTVLSYQGERGLQLESVGSGLVLLWARLGGPPTAVVSNFSSMNLSGSAAGAWLSALPWLTAAVFGLVAWLGYRRMRSDLRADGVVATDTIVLLAATAIVALLVTNKVFSTQYVVWLVPFAGLLSRSRFWLAVVAIALSSLIHPVVYDQLIAQDALAIAVLNVRNGLLVALLVALGVDLWRGRGVARPAGLEPTTFRSAT